MTGRDRRKRFNRGEVIVAAIAIAPVACLAAAVISIATSGDAPAAAAATPSATTTASHAPDAWDRFWADLNKPPTPRPGSTTCGFQGQNLACVQHWPDGHTSVKPVPFPVSNDQYNALVDDGLTSTWYSPEPGREQYLTPQEVTSENKPFAPERTCPDGDYEAWVPDCPDLSAGVVHWWHGDGTDVVVAPQWQGSYRWPNPAPKPRRCPDSDLWVPYVPTCPSGAS